MNLTYRGVSCTSLVANVPAAAAEQIGFFLGKQSVMKQPLMSFHQYTEALMYRGIS